MPGEDLHSKIAAYMQQLEQVESMLQSDPDNEQFLKLQTDLRQVIALTENLVTIQTNGIQEEEALDKEDENVEGVFIRAKRDPMPQFDISSYKVSDRIEVISGDRPYAAIITEIDPEGPIGHVKVWYYEIKSEVILPMSDIRKIGKSLVKESDIVFPFSCLCKFSQDQKWYEAIVTEKSIHGYMVTYTAYGQQDEVPLEYLKRSQQEKKKEEQIVKEFIIPPNLQISTGDTEDEKAKKKKKIKFLKNKFKEKQEVNEIVAVQSSWKNFVQKGTKKNVAGITKSSMFASPDTVDGKVGVTNSGKSLTEFGDRKRFKSSAFKPS